MQNISAFVSNVFMLARARFVNKVNDQQDINQNFEHVVQASDSKLRKLIRSHFFAFRSMKSICSCLRNEAKLTTKNNFFK